MPSSPRTYEQIWDQIERTSSCWLWRGNCVKGHRYVRVVLEPHGPKRYLHRVIYEAAKGPIPKGHDINHLCGNRLCMNPDHMETLTRSEHARKEGKLDGHRVSGWQREVTHCPRGHPYDEVNTYRSAEGHRFCRACRRKDDAARSH